MTLLTIYKIDGGNPLTLDLEPNYKIKIHDVKEYISDLFGIDAEEVKLFIRFSKNNLLLEQTNGEYLQGIENRYLFSTNPEFTPDPFDTLAITDSLDNLLQS
jgi:hypothetical protein